MLRRDSWQDSHLRVTDSGEYCKAVSTNQTVLGKILISIGIWKVMPHIRG